MAYTYKYPRPAVTADCVVITKASDQGAAFDKEEVFRDVIITGNKSFYDFLLCHF